MPGARFVDLPDSSQEISRVATRAAGFWRGTFGGVDSELAYERQSIRRADHDDA
jgi:hypothetical protein